MRVLGIPLLLAVVAGLMLGNTVAAHDGHDPHELAPSVIKVANLVPFVKITEETDRYIIESNAIPSHETGQFPNRANPNAIAAQDITKYVTKLPQKSDVPIDVKMPGIAVNGVLFEPGTAECFGQQRQRGGGASSQRQQQKAKKGSGVRPPRGPRDNSGQGARRLRGKGASCDWREEAIVKGVGRLGLDRSNAHVQPSGLYHYHGIPLGLVAQLIPDASGLVHIGYAADGHFMFVDPKRKFQSSWRLKSGLRSSGPLGIYDGTYTQDFVYQAGSGELDECNGMVFQGRYIYILTESFPFVPRCLKGKPDPSFSRSKGRQ